MAAVTNIVKVQLTRFGLALVDYGGLVGHDKMADFHRLNHISRPYSGQNGGLSSKLNRDTREDRRIQGKSS